LKITIIDYGAGNVRNVFRAIDQLGIKPIISADPKDILSSDGVILPGVGAAQDTMNYLNEKNLIEPIKQYINAKNYFLGVCMGLQALFDYSLEGGRQQCLGIIPGKIVRFPDDLVVPHMGWNQINIIKKHKLIDGISDKEYFYFVHSFYPEPSSKEVVIATSKYGNNFPSIVAQNNVYATQFHPEKSGEVGLRIYHNFINIVKNGIKT
tara:strand:- start:2829 stop:3452 length:624 start_codon:yes stop_codon:yes gene_type:complete